MPVRLEMRENLISAFNASHFILRHYAKGYYPVARKVPVAMPVNRMFFPLKNPHGEENFIEDGSRRYPLIPGRMYFVPAFFPACFHLDDQLFFLSIQTNLEIFPCVELFSGCPRMLEIPSMEKERNELIRYFDSEKTSPYFNSLKSGLKIFSLLTSLLDYYAPEDFRKPLSLRKYVVLTDYLKRNGSAVTSVSDLAREQNESRESFTRHFTAETGITPKQLIDRFVIGRCLSLIEEGLFFKEIAARMKFRDEFAFSRYFSRNMGESPRSWRRRRMDTAPSAHSEFVQKSVSRITRHSHS